MNYILRPQSSVGRLRLLVNNTRLRDTRSYVCGHCLGNHLILNNNSRNLSTYHSALKLILKRKEIQKKVNVNSNPFQKELIKSPEKKKKISDRFTELVKIHNNKSKETKVTIQQLKASDVTSFASKPGMTFESTHGSQKCIFDSIRSYDPNVLVPVDFIDGLCYKNLISPAKKSKKTKTSVQKSVKNSNYINQMSTVKIKSISLKTNPVASNKNYKLKKSSVKEKQVKLKNATSGAFKILPMSTVEIFPMPERLKANISKISERAIKELPKREPTAVPLQQKNFNFLLPKISEENQLKVKELSKVEEEKQEPAENLKNYQIQLPFKNKFKVLIQSYIDVAVQNQMEEEALKFLSSYRSKPEWESMLKNNFVDVYNMLLHSYSAKGDRLRTSEIIKWMKADNVKFNSQTYAAILECLGRAGFKNESLFKEELIIWLQNLYNDGLKPTDLFTNTILTKDKRDKILEVIRKILPNFETESIISELNSNCILLKDLHKGFNTLQSPLENGTLVETIEECVKEQLLLEKNYKIEIESVYKNSDSNVTRKDREKMDKWFNEWRGRIHQGFVQSLEKVKAYFNRFPEKINLYFYLNSIPVEMFVDTMMEEVKTVVNFSGGYSPSTSVLYKQLGNSIYNRYETKKKIDLGTCDRMEKLFKKYGFWYLNPSGPAMNSRQEWQTLIQCFQEESYLDVEEVPWPNCVKHALGKYLYDIILKEVKISVGDRQIPAFYRLMRYKHLKHIEEVKCHPIVSKLFKKISYERLVFNANQMPMVCPPKPWKTVDDGGYLILPTDFMRKLKDDFGKDLDLKKFSSQQLYAAFDSLNALQTTPWIINEEVLDVALEVFKKGGPKKLEVPQLPDTDPIPINITPEMSLVERFEEHRKRKKIANERQNAYALWCEALYKLSLANHFRKKVFWFPQNFDFRGRVYPVPPHLNHLGADLFRSLLTFAKGKPLGPKGLDWIKIHTINLTGTHKTKSVQERLEYANSILPTMIDSAERPLTGEKWWMDSDEPWQTLASCIELKKILSSSNPELYISKFPIHQDGSCNGLQHYAALGRDTVGAKSVNLSPSPLPQDVYSVVVEIIEEKRRKDAANGVEIARMLDGFVKRKVVKQTIMTTVYGVTLFGAKHQICRQLEGLDNFPKEHVWKAASYLSKKTFESLQEMFTSAKAIQEWFIKCASTICAKKEYVYWISPLGLPILQPYGKLYKSVENKKRSIAKPNLMKQKNAFPPNFVHSLDSSHMMLTALFCEQAGITFASIHDCYWTHPCTVDKMNKICREQFISLHSQKILENLSKFFVEQYKGNYENDDSNSLEIFNAVPKVGDFNLGEVLNSVYFFS